MTILTINYILHNHIIHFIIACSPHLQAGLIFSAITNLLPLLDVYNAAFTTHHGVIGPDEVDWDALFVHRPGFDRFGNRLELRVTPGRVTRRGQGDLPEIRRLKSILRELVEIVRFICPDGVDDIGSAVVVDCDAYYRIIFLIFVQHYHFI